jgi:hypothetical protein
MEVLYHIRPYFLEIFTYIGLIGLIYGRYLHFRILEFPLIMSPITLVYDTYNYS